MGALTNFLFIERFMQKMQVTILGISEGSCICAFDYIWFIDAPLRRWIPFESSVRFLRVIHFIREGTSESLPGALRWEVGHFGHCLDLCLLSLYPLPCSFFQILSSDLRNSPSLRGLASFRFQKTLPIHQICRPPKARATRPSWRYPQFRFSISPT